MINYNEIDPMEVRRLFDYRDGSLFWRPRLLADFPSEWSWKVWNKNYAGKEAGYLRPDGYITVRILNKAFRLHRMVWAWHFGRWPSDQLDHIDHDRSNCRIENLREVTNAENCKNKSPVRLGKSGIFGVFFETRSGRWMAKITSGKKITSLGAYPSKEAAAVARKAAEAAYGFHKNHGRQF